MAREYRNGAPPPAAPCAAWGRSMHNEYGPFLRFLFRRLLKWVRVDPGFVRAIEEVPTDRTLVYVLSSASLADYLIFNALCLHYGLPAARFANDVPMLVFQPPAVALRAALSRLNWLLRPTAFRLREECRIATGVLSRGEPILLFLKKPGFFFRPLRFKVLVWEEIIRAERRGRCRVTLVPVVFLWGKEPDRLQRSAWDTIFGDRSAPGFRRKLILMARHIRRLTVRTGRPFSLGRFLDETGHLRDELLAKKLRRLLSSFIFRERRLAVGPPIRNRSRVIRTLLCDPTLPGLVAGVARRQKQSEKRVWKKAKSILEEMVSDYNQPGIAVAYRVFQWIWRRLYGDCRVDEEGLSRLIPILKDHPVILTPCHKSHVDYLLLSSVFFERNISIPHIAAGMNLAFWPMEKIFRRSGAFFIRRSIAGDILYVRLLAIYIRWLIRTGYSQEFFLEGGRSRTGKLLKPMQGLLTMEIDAFLDGAARDLYLAPVAISYDRVVEETSYRAELSGQEKVRENFWALWRSRKLLGRYHGAVHVRFGRPVSLRRFFDQESKPRISKRDRKAKTDELVAYVMREIGENLVVTTTGIASCALLSSPGPRISRAEFADRLSRLVSVLRDKGSPRSAEADMENPDAVLRFCERSGWIRLRGGENDGGWIDVRRDRRLTLDYYKNGVLHHFLPEAVLASALAANVGENDFIKALAFLLDFLSVEFFFADLSDPEAVAAEARRNVGEGVEAPVRDLFSGLIGNYLEAYDLTALVTMEEGWTTPPLARPMVRRILQAGQEAYGEKRISRVESLSTALFEGAFSYFYEKGFTSDPGKLRAWRQDMRRFLG